VSAVRPATSGDRAAIAGVLARAFHDDPVFSWILPDPDRRAAQLPKLFAILYDEDAAGMRLTTPDVQATTLWRGPGQARTGWLATLRHAPALVSALGTALPRALAASNAVEAHFPRGDFWYLHIAGCDPAAQGRGLGGRLVREGLARAAGRLPCYLETAKEANLGFYRNLGWEVIGDWRIGRDGPRLWSMLRPAG
jgi:ribosomal protein S18 acetylase RimI-like enzyme